MRNPSPHRYATRPGLYFTEDGGADAVVRSETADQLWFCVYEPEDQPTSFYSEATPPVDDGPDALLTAMRQYPTTTRVIPSLHLRETLLRMSGPNYGLWYVHLPKAWDGMRYAYRADGTWDPAHGVRFNPFKVLLDPYGKGIEGHSALTPAAYSYQCSMTDGMIEGSPNGPMSMLDSLGSAPLSVAIDDRDATKHDNEPIHPHVSWSKTVIYELHVKGFTAKAPWLPERLRGTYAGLAHPQTLTYLQRLGVTSIELLPIQAKQSEASLTQRGLTNYWGYSTLGYFAPEPSYATAEAQRRGPAAVREEVIAMVHALHSAGFEVIMDVVYNHTCEGGADGPTVCWRGLDDLSYYRRDPEHPGTLEDTTGCGNTLDFTNTHVVTFAIDSLRYWAKRIGIDGFRFDLAASLARLDGAFTHRHPLLYALRSDLLLGNLKLIMEPWDLGEGGWRTGQFGVPFSEWNDRFRNHTRTFWIDGAKPTKGRPSIGMQDIATRLCGSADLYATEPGRGATASVNYVTSHDGFTLHDLTSYNDRHNEANGEQNRDGDRSNHSWNFGVEGPSINPRILDRRERTGLNMIGTLLMALGTPMLRAGDEFCNTQMGNNNAYAQDNDISWLDWSWMREGVDGRRGRFATAVSQLITIRKSLDLYHHEEFFTRLTQLGLLKQSSRVQWQLADGTTPMERDWRDHAKQSFTMRLTSTTEGDVLVVINASRSERDFHLPSDATWHCVWNSTQTLGEEPRRVADIPATDSGRGPVRGSTLDGVIDNHTLGDHTWSDRGSSDHAPSDHAPAGDAGTESPAPSNLWSIPSMSISLFQQEV